MYQTGKLRVTRCHRRPESKSDQVKELDLHETVAVVTTSQAERRKHASRSYLKVVVGGGSSGIQALSGCSEQD